MADELGQRNAAGHRVWSKNGETIVSSRWVEGWTALLDGPWEFNNCGCTVTACEHDAIRRLIHRKAEENARLRALIKDAEKANCGDGYQWKCPWCGSVLGGDQPDVKPEPHQDDCPAFTPSGDVR